MNSNTRHPQARSSKRSRSAKLAALLGVVVLTATACTSDPSAQRVAKDLVNTLVTDDDQRQCMLDKIDGYGKETLENISKQADEITASQNIGEVSDIQQFQDDLESCA